MTVLERIFARLEAEGECWIWTGAKTRLGYGQIRIERRTEYVHRTLYELAHGQIPPGLVLDHLCRNPSCARPSHLEPVSQKENVVRGESGAWQRRKTHCPHGHPYSPENTYSRPSRPNERACRTCRRESKRK